MRQAIHIFRKDVRYLWIEIAAALLAALLLALTARTGNLTWNAALPRQAASLFITGLLPFAWWFLIVRAVHAEALTGDREFWTTRPYSWKSLLAAKALFLAVFINLPLFFAQAVVVSAHGFSPLSELSGLMWNQVLMTIAFIIPVAAIAALTGSIAQFLIIGLLAFAAMFLLSMRFLVFAAAMIGAGWGPLEWILNYYGLAVVSLFGAGILIWQYARRRTVMARLAAAAAAVVLTLGAPISWASAFGLQSRLSRVRVDESALQAGWNPDFRWMTRVLVERGGTVSLHIPLKISGLRDDVEVRPEAASLTIEGVNGAVWKAAADQPRANVSSTGQLIALQTQVDALFYEPIKGAPVSVRGYVYATLYGNRRVWQVPFNERPMRVPGMGICQASAGKGAPYFLVCNSVFRPEQDLVSVRFEQSAKEPWSGAPPRLLSYSPFPAEFSLDPVNSYVAYSVYRGHLDAATVISTEPLSHVRVPIAIDGLVPGQFEARL